MGKMEMSRANMEESQNVDPLTARLEEPFSYSLVAAPLQRPLKHQQD